MKRKWYNRIFAGVVCMAILFTILSSTCFGISNGDHKCSRNHCTVCEHLKELFNISRDIGDGIGIFLLAFLAKASFSEKGPQLFKYIISLASLISLKVRMNN
ncbi:hypothetical protein [Clostridium aminobutyricum]|uniref:Uncharacterized protein n=1 Tax=Clostridium aminobutyricum TaxID=33953 RepID=A0A939IFY6_CLOAM|nr:hypothetical protein [Clostridium aminobutyricum]MBN7772180.1 hypothetical protein [Clostridium aminobutyricum]